VGLERGIFSLVSTTEELLGRNSSGSGLENLEYGRGDPLRSPRDTSGGRSIGIVRLRTKATEFVCIATAPILKLHNPSSKIFSTIFASLQFSIFHFFRSVNLYVKLSINGKCRMLSWRYLSTAPKRMQLL
jgi:hypothetical protein